MESFFWYQLLAAKSLCVESMKVCKELKKGDTEGARKAVSMIVGRDTSVLDTAGITRAAVETVAENTSDGVIAPFLFMAIFGPGPHFRLSADTGSILASGGRRKKCLAHIFKRPA